MTPRLGWVLLLAVLLGCAAGPRRAPDALALRAGVHAQPGGPGGSSSGVKSPLTMTRLVRLWHVPGGPLVLLGRGGGEEDTLIEDPFAGWEERCEGVDYSVPYFAGWPSALLLEVYTPGWRGLERELLQISGLSYYGDYYEKAHPSTRRWWRRLRAWMRRHATPVTRSGPWEGPHPDLWALPAALRAIQAGRARNDWPLTLQPPPRPWRFTSSGSK